MHPDKQIASSLNESTPATFTSFEEGWIFSAVAVGRLAGALPTVGLMNHAGLKITFTIFGILSGFSTLLMPIFSTSFHVALLVRCLQGLGVTSVYVAHGAIPLAWGGPAEQGLLVSLLSCSYELAPMLTMALSGFFCTSSLGWPGVYYLFGSTTILSFGAFFVIYSNSPLKNRFTLPKVSQSSISVLPTDKTRSIKRRKLSVPYKSIFSSPSVWGVWMTALGDAVGYQMFIMYGPIYINKVLHYEVAKTGMLAAFPFLISIGTKFLGGIFIDKATCVGDHSKIVFFTSFSQAAMTACFLMLTFLSADTYVLAQAVFTLTIVFSGLHCVGVFSGSQNVARQFNHILTSIMAVENGLVSFFLPTIVASVAPNHESTEWANIFYYIVGVLVATNLTFVVFTKVKPATWTTPAILELKRNDVIT